MDASRYGYFVNKSFVTNMLALGLIVLSYSLKGSYQATLNQIGLFALSGALTNWLAVFMLFEKIPLLYGSGVILVRFAEFKQGLRQLIMQEFFNERTLETVLPKEKDWQDIVDKLDYNKLYESLVAGILASPFGSMISVMGTAKMTESLRRPLQKKLRVAMRDMMAEKALQDKLAEKLVGGKKLLATVEEMVDCRLAQLTPLQVKEIIQAMIRKHLGWLVVWGGVFGGVIGGVASWVRVI